MLMMVFGVYEAKIAPLVRAALAPVGESGEIVERAFNAGHAGEIPLHSAASHHACAESRAHAHA